MNPKLKQGLGWVLKFALVAALLVFLVRKGLLSWELTVQALSNYAYSIPAFLILFSGSAIAFFRWYLLLRAQGIMIPLGRTVQLGLIGTFFNLALPGSVSGDLVKAFYIAKETPALRGRAFGAILFDRILGLSGQMVVAITAVLVTYNSLSHSPFLAGIRIILLLGGVGFAAFYFYLFFVPEHRDLVLMGLKRLEAWHIRFGSLVRIYEGVKHYQGQKIAVLKALAMSVVLHALIATACWRFALALDQDQLRLVPLMIAVPLGLLVTAVPIMPAGIGTGHAAMGWLVHLLGSDRGADLYSPFAISQLIVGAVGGIVYLRYRQDESESVTVQS